MSIHSRGVEVPAQVRDYLSKKLRRLDRHLHSQAQSVVEIRRSSARSAEERLVVQITINNNGALLRGEQSASNIFGAIDAAADVLDRQILRFKDRLHRRGRTGLSRSLAEPPEAEMTETEAPEEGSRVVRSKTFLVEPMSPDEAAEQMELLGHDFYVFLNTDTGRLGVVYRRREGDYGLLDPQLP